MAGPRVSAEDYIQWLIASPNTATMTEAARCSPQPVAHDSYRRLLERLEPDSEALWVEVKAEVDPSRGVLILDDSTLDKPYGPNIELVSWHWSGKHRDVVQGINLVTLLWTDGVKFIPVDYRIYHRDSDQKTKNDHFTDMLKKAQERGFQPRAVLFDSWYASVRNLKFIRNAGWIFLTRLKSNRIVSLSPTIYCHVGQLLTDEEGLKVHLKEFGFIRVFRTRPPDGDVRFWATNDLDLDTDRRLSLLDLGFSIEHYHRTLKQDCNVERCQARLARLQRNHIGLAIRAFVRLELHRLRSHLSTWQMKGGIVREAIRSYLAQPRYHIPAA